MENQHPFAQYIRTLGRGKKGSRALTEDEAYEAMSMILDGHIEPEQLGAFLMLVRVKEETPAEVAGFVRAVRERLPLGGHLPVVDLDWSSYAGKRRHLPWFLLSVMLLVENGIRVFMHGLEGRKDDRIYTPAALTALGLPISTSLSDAAQRIEHTGFAYLNLDQLCPRLQQLIDLRELLGLRSPVHTVSRLINPFQAPCVMQGIFHPGYLEIHQGAGELLQQPRLSVIKGDGGEIEMNPDADSRVLSVINGELKEDTWPAMFSKRHIKDEQLDLGRLLQLWRGDINDEYGTGAIILTCAVTLHTMGRVNTLNEAKELASTWWQKRNTSLLPGTMHR